MELTDEIKYYRKEPVFERYTRIVDNFKDYEKITKVKMLEAILLEYTNYENIISICTEKELKFLKMVLARDPNCTNEKYNWERNALDEKFLITCFGKEIQVPSEIISYVKEALKNINWKEVKQSDQINHLLVSHCKIMGSCLLNNLIEIGCYKLDFSRDIIADHIMKNRNFKYYVSIDRRKKGDHDYFIAYHNDYYYILDELYLARKKQGRLGNVNIDIDDYTTLFYNEFNIKNSKIKRFYDELTSLHFFYHQAIEYIRECVLLNSDRTEMKELIESVPSLADIDLTNFFKYMDEAMDEMPSGALNGITPNQLTSLEKEEKQTMETKIKKQVKQQDACLSEKEVASFYKLYFGLLEYTNKLYKINPQVKIYKQKGINPQDIIGVVEKLWELTDEIITDFCLKNPYKFTKEELNTIKEFKKGTRNIFIIMEYTEEYAAFMTPEKVYMVKGINSNIDEVIPYLSLPYVVRTSIIPFNNKLIYDSILLSHAIDFGPNFFKLAKEEYKTHMKYYHL